MKYVEYALGSVANRNRCCTQQEVDGIILPSVNGQALYKSYYTFDNALPNWLKTNGSVKGFEGVYYLENIIFDIDRGRGTDDWVLTQTQGFITKLLDNYKIPENYIQPWFSGNGYHVSIPDVFHFSPSRRLPQTVRTTLKEYFPEVDPIYDGSRLIRVGYTVNPKTGLYKIPLSMKEIYSYNVDTIHKLARSNKPREEITNILEPLKLMEIVELNNEPASIMTNRNIRPSAIATCIQKLIQLGPASGTRRNTLLRLVSYARRNGFPLEIASQMYIEWNQQNPMSSKEYNDIINYIYTSGKKYGCNDAIMDKHCSNKCIYYTQKTNHVDPMLTTTNVADWVYNYRQKLMNSKNEDRLYLRTVWENFKDGFYLSPGEIAILNGDTGVGKTAFCQNIAYYSGKKVLYLSLEVNLNLINRRFIQIAHKFTKEQANTQLIENPDTCAELLTKIDTLSMPPNIEGIRRLIAELEPDLLIVDPLDGIKPKRYTSDNRQRVDSAILGLREIVDTYEVIALVVAHPGKAESRLGMMDAHSSKDSATIGQKADVIFAFEGSRSTSRRMLRTTKARDGNPIMEYLDFEPLTFNFTTHKN